MRFPGDGGRVLQRFMLGVAMLALLAGPALAQARRVPPAMQPKKEDIQKKKEREEIDRKYQETLRHSQNKKPAKVDPWANMRGEKPQQ
jgi:hypothetical protein